MGIQRLAAFVLAAVMALAIPLATSARTTSGNATSAGASAAQPTATNTVNTFTNIPVEGTLSNNRTFRGVLDIVNFRVIDGQLFAVGDLSGRVFNAAGDVVRTITDERVWLPVTFGSITSCDILRLRLGPLDLDVLGLVIHLDRVVLDITAEAGPGNLLGNLLCAIAHLLDGGLDVDLVLRDLLRAILETFQL